MAARLAAIAVLEPQRRFAALQPFEAGERPRNVVGMHQVHERRAGDLRLAPAKHSPPCRV